MAKRAYEPEDLTVGKLIEILQGYDANMKIGEVGYAGDFFPADERDIRTQHVISRRVRGYAHFDVDYEVLTIGMPDIGPEPD